MLLHDDTWLTNMSMISGAIYENATFSCTAVEFAASPTDLRRCWGTTSSNSHRGCFHTGRQYLQHFSLCCHLPQRRNRSRICIQCTFKMVLKCRYKTHASVFSVMKSKQIKVLISIKDYSYIRGKF